jgi:hypothetical protein
MKRDLLDPERDIQRFCEQDGGSISWRQFANVSHLFWPKNKQTQFSGCSNVNYKAAKKVRLKDKLLLLCVWDVSGKEFRDRTNPSAWIYNCT